MKIQKLLPVGSFLIIIFLMFTSSCLDDKYDFERISDEIELKPGLAAPIAYGTFELQDFLDIFAEDIDEVGVYDSGPDANLIYISFQKDLFSYKASEVVDIPDQDFLELFIDSDFDLPTETLPVGTTINLQKTQMAEFVFENNERIDSINLKTATLVIDVTSTFQHSGVLTISSEDVLLDGQPFSEVIQISQADGNFSETRPIVLDGYTIRLDNESDPVTTFLPLEFNLQLTNSGNPVEADDNCNITMGMQNIEFSSVYGYLGDYNILIADGSIDVPVFDEEPEEGELKFYDPRFKLNVTNSYGIPVQVELIDVNAYFEINDVTTPITFTGINPFDIAAPSIAHVGDSASTTIEINRSNCNIADAIAEKSNSFTYTVNAVTNPENTTRNNFVTDSSDMLVDFEVLLPLWINAQGFGITDTSEFNFEEEVGDTDFLDYFRIKLGAENGLPMQVFMQVYFTDENYQVIDSLFKDNDLFLESAILNDQDEVASTFMREKLVEYDKDGIESLKPVKHAIIDAKINTYESDADRYVKFMTNYGISFELSFRANAIINSRRDF